MDPPSLGNDEIHIWRASLEGVTEPSGLLGGFLSSGERIRAARYRFAETRDRFIQARSFLRTMIGRYLKVHPASIRFSYNQYGKPSLSGPEASPRLEFSISHSGNVAALALCRRRRIGIDVEVRRSLDDMEAIVEGLFSPVERAQFHDLPESLRHRAFFNAWTVKEAYLKALGTGLNEAIDNVEVAMTPIEPPAILSIRGDAQAPRRWAVTSVHVSDLHACSLVIEAGSLPQCRYLEMQSTRLSGSTALR